MANLFQPSLYRALDDNGDPISGAKFYFYLSETTTDATWYTNPEGSVPGSNPQIADLNGKFSPVYLDEDVVYTIVHTDADDLEIWSVDNVPGFNNIGGTNYNPTIDVSNLPFYATPAAGIAAVEDGERFVETPLVGGVARVYARSGTSATFVDYAAVNSEGLTTEASIRRARALPNRAQYELDMRNVVNGQMVVNTGTRADFKPFPTLNQTGDNNVLFDNDGGTNGFREVFPTGVLNSLGQEKVIQCTFDNVNDDYTFIYNPDLDNIGSFSATFAIRVRLASGSTAYSCEWGSTSDAQGSKTTFTPTSNWQWVTVDVENYDPSVDTWSVALRPSTSETGVSTTPMVLDIEARLLLPLGASPPSMQDIKNFGGHALPATGVPGSGSFVSGYFTPTEDKVANLLVDLDGTSLDSFRLTAVVDMPDKVYASSSSYAAAFPIYKRLPFNRDYDVVGIGINTSDRDGSSEYSGKLVPAPEAGGGGLQEVLDCNILGRGPTRIDIQYGDDSENALQAYSDPLLAVRDKRLLVMIDGVPALDTFIQTIDPILQQVLSIGGTSSSSVKGDSGINGQNIESPIYLVKFDPNVEWKEAKDIAEEVAVDQALGRYTLNTNINLVWEGDSTFAFAGTPPSLTGSLLNPPGFLNTDISIGGAYWDTLPPVFINCFNYHTRIQMRELVYDCATTVGFNKSILFFGGGINNLVKDIGSGAPEAFARYKAQFIDAEMAGRTDTLGAIVGLKPAWVGGLTQDSTGLNQVVKDWNDYLRSLFPNVHPDCPYLFYNDDPSVTGFTYFIDLGAWVPHDDTITYDDWYHCINDAKQVTVADSSEAQADALVRDHFVGVYRISGAYWRYSGPSDPGGSTFTVTNANAETVYYFLDASGPDGLNKVMSGDLVHWFGGFNRWASEDIFIPAITAIAEDVGHPLQ